MVYNYGQENISLRCSIPLIPNRGQMPAVGNLPHVGNLRTIIMDWKIYCGWLAFHYLQFGGRNCPVDNLPPCWEPLCHVWDAWTGVAISIVVTEIFLFLHLGLVQTGIVARLRPLEEAALYHSIVTPQCITTAIPYSSIHTSLFTPVLVQQ